MLKLANIGSNLPKRPQYKVCVSKFISWIGQRPINEESLREYFQFLLSEMSPASVRLAKTSIKLWILKNHPSKNNVVFRNGIQMLFHELKVPKPNVSVTDSKLLTEKELKLLAKKLPIKYSLILRILYGAGCRISELLSVKISHCIDLQSHIETKVIGKGGKENLLIISKNLFVKAKEVFGGREYLFENSGFGKPYTRQMVHRKFKSVGLIELNRRVYPHQTRHSRISHLLRQGKPLDGVSRFVHHFNCSYTANVYGQNKLTTIEILKSAIL